MSTKAKEKKFSKKVDSFVAVLLKDIEDYEKSIKENDSVMKPFMEEYLKELTLFVKSMSEDYTKIQEHLDNPNSSEIITYWNRCRVRTTDKEIDFSKKVTLTGSK